MTGARIAAWSASALGVFSLFLSACAGGGGIVPPLTPPVVTLRDLGERSARQPVDVGIVLRLNRRKELERLVSEMANPHSSRYHRFLTPREFNAHFAPTQAQQQVVLATLRRAGFNIVRTFPNRELIDARGTTANAERFFGTRIHDFEQPRYGRRYANVTMIRLPSSWSAIVEGVELSDVILAHAGPKTVPSAPRQAVAPSEPTIAGRNVVRNPGFETGKLKPWYACGTAKPAEAAISTLHPYSGKFDAITGSPDKTSGEPKGMTGICQAVKIPRSATLSAYLFRESNQKSVKKAAQMVAILSSKGKIVAMLDKAAENRPRWVLFSSPSLATYAGQKLTLFFGVSGDGDPKGFVTQFVDDVALHTVATPTPSPSPTPTPAGPGQPIGGPTYGPDSFNSEDGWGPRGVADGFDLPVQNGYNGSGVTVAILIDDAMSPTDLANYDAYFQLASQGGSVTTEPAVSGAPATPDGNDPLETSLDAETISALAPGANVVVYSLPELSNLNVENGYQTILNDAATTGKPHASVVNSSFDECESEDATFDNDVEQDAVSGAAIGITFVAVTGDWGPTCYHGGSSHPVGVNVPAAAPHVLAVGGNESDPEVPPSGHLGIANPVAWNNCSAGFNSVYCATGGGVSTVFTPLPSYQSGVAGLASTTARNLPDIAYPAVFDDIFAGGTHYLIVGTSWAGPIASALLAETVQICGPLGWVNPAIYSVFKTDGEAPYFIDVTSGTNIGYMGDTAGYTAKVGYDNVSGIGMPYGSTFTAALCQEK
jgi:hypothetical protein